MCGNRTDSPGEGRRLRKLLASFFGGFYYYFSFLVRLLGICYSCVCVKPQDRQYECKLKTRQRRHAETGRKKEGQRERGVSEKRKVKDARKTVHNAEMKINVHVHATKIVKKTAVPKARQQDRKKEKGRGRPRDVPKKIKNNFQNKNFLSCARESSSNSCCSCCCSPF